MAASSISFRRLPSASHNHPESFFESNDLGNDTDTMNDLWDLTLRFFSLADANVRYVVAGSIILGVASGAIGSFAFLQRKSLVGDALAHAALPGVCLAFMITGSKAPFALFLGAAATGWLGAIAINHIVRLSRLQRDAALGLALSRFFGLGVALLTIIQNSGAGNQSGLDKYVFGQAASMALDDVITIGIVASVMILTITALFKDFKLVTFDAAHAVSLGRPVRMIQFALTALLVLAVTVGLQAVGVVLMAAMLVTPAAAARQWTNSLPKMIMLSGAIGAVSGIVGAYISFLAPQLPTGPWIVVTAGGVFLVSLLFAPERGMIAQYVRRLSAEQRIVRDHLLKAFFRLRVAGGASVNMFEPAVLASEARLVGPIALGGLRRLKADNLAAESDHGWALTEPGKATAERVVRLHRLWEVYLSRYLSLPTDHVHRDADELEHLITPEMEKRLEALLEHPERDPHDRPIPYPTDTPAQNVNRIKK